MWGSPNIFYLWLVGFAEMYRASSAFSNIIITNGKSTIVFPMKS